MSDENLPMMRAQRKSRQPRHWLFDLVPYVSVLAPRNFYDSKHAPGSGCYNHEQNTCHSICDACGIPRTDDGNALALGEPRYGRPATQQLLDSILRHRIS